MKKIAIFGIGISGISLIDYLVQSSKNIIAIDDSVESLDRLKEKYQNKIELLNKIDFCHDLAKINWKNLEYLIISPSISLKYPNPHKIVELASENNCKIIGDLELFYLLNENKNFIGITGTNGKSTVTSLIGHIFKENKIDSAIGGNIGIPVFDLNEVESYIFEISSYQLDLSNKLKFNIAALLNITPDHLDRYNGMAGYIKSKEQIFKNQNQNDFTLINVDDLNCYKIYQNLIENKEFKAKIIPLSIKNSLSNSISFIDDRIINNINKKSYIIPENQYLKGNHNKQNILFSYAASYLSKINDEDIIKSIKNFKGLKHRLQFLKKMQNITFINDSKATNIESASCALESYDNIFWIVGGESKNNDLSLILKHKNKIKKIFLIGRDQKLFANFFNKNKMDNYLCHNLDKAFLEAVNFAKDTKDEINILLSPACSSFDQWSNFEERGDYFCKLVNKFNYE